MEYVNIEVVNLKKYELLKRGYKDVLDWKSKGTCLYIGRDMTRYVPGTEGSKWGNPFKSYKYGERSIEMYEEHIRNTSELWNSLEELLQYKEIGCWCKPEPCHGDVLVKLLKEKLNKDKK